MSRIGKKLIPLPSTVTATIGPDLVSFKGPKGELKVKLATGIRVEQIEAELKVTRLNEQRQTLALHGLMRSLLANAVQGVEHGFSKTLKLVGTGYRVQAKGSGLNLAVGFSHPVEFMPPAEIVLKVEGNDTIRVSGIDKHLVGQVAANIRAISPPEPYKGKGIRYEDEFVKIKPGKTTTA